MRRNRKQKKQRKVIIISVIGLLCIMTAGYASFQTNLNITAKGNIKENPITIQELRDTYCNTISGDGLYKDTYETNKCIYKGANPNNYITFNNETWRIISIESDNIIKIIKNERISNMVWDTTNSNNWRRPASINIYLNSDYYNSLNEDAKSKIISHDFSVGAVEWNNTNLANQINAENNTKWNGNVGLITEGEYLKVNTNSTQCGNYKLMYDNRDLCPSTNYINQIAGDLMWTITARDQFPTYTFWISKRLSSTGNHVKDYEFGIFPVVHLSQNIKLTGKGTEETPYIIR